MTPISSAQKSATVAIIPARGGSKRIPRKNIKLFNGNPLISYPIRAALASGLFDEVVVSTDCDEIAQVARDFGASVPFMRPAALADDYTGTTAVVRHGISTLRDMGRSVDTCCCIYATTPLLDAAILASAGKELLSNPALDYVFSACRFSFPIQRALIKDAGGGVAPFDVNSIGMRSQDLQPTFHDAGQFYWGRADAFLDPHSAVFGPKSRMALLPDYLVADIDTEDDWRRAEVLYRALQLDGKR